MYQEAIRVCEYWRLGKGQFKLTSATPAQINLYNVFTQAKQALSNELAVIEDVQGIYMKKGKKNV